MDTLNQASTVFKGVGGVGTLELMSAIPGDSVSEIVKVALQAIIAIATLVSLLKKKNSINDRLNKE